MPGILLQYFPRPKVILVISEGLLIGLCGLFAWTCFIKVGKPFSAVIGLSLAVAMGVLGLYLSDHYEGSQRLPKHCDLSQLLTVLFTLALLTSLLLLPLPDGRPALLLVAASWGLAGIMVPLWRMACTLVLPARWFKRRIALVGSSTTAQAIRLETAKQQRTDLDLIIIPATIPDTTKSGSHKGYRRRIRGAYREVYLNAKALHARAIINCIDPERDYIHEAELQLCQLFGMKIFEGKEFYAHLLRRIPLDSVGQNDINALPRASMGVWQQVTKRTLDLVLAGALLLVFLPLMVTTALLVRWRLKAPALVKRPCLGANQQLFYLYRFNFKTPAGNPNSSISKRLTHIMRRRHIDKLPQLVNVIKGQMSLVGPQTCRPQAAACLSRKLPAFAHRCQLKPGLTGWAQLNGAIIGNASTAHNTIGFDLYYLQNRSLVVDMAILLKTLKEWMYLPVATPR